MKPKQSFIRSNLICIVLFILIVIIPMLSFGLSIKTESGVTVGSYAGSYALLIGVSNYTNGWPDLESIPGDIDMVQGVLLEQGFNVQVFDFQSSLLICEIYEICGQIPLSIFKSRAHALTQ